MNHGTACGGGGADQKQKTCRIQSRGRSSRSGLAVKGSDLEEFTCSDSFPPDLEADAEQCLQATAVFPVRLERSRVRT